MQTTKLSETHARFELDHWHTAVRLLPVLLKEEPRTWRDVARGLARIYPRTSAPWWEEAMKDNGLNVTDPIPEDLEQRARPFREKRRAEHGAELEKWQADPRIGPLLRGEAEPQ